MKYTSLAFLSILLIILNFTNCELPSNNNLKAEEYNTKGLNLLDYNLGDEAIPNFKKAIELASPGNPDLLYYNYNLSIAFFELGERDSCTFYTRQALKYTQPNSYQYYCLKGDIDLFNDKIKEGVFNLKKACSLQPQNLDANNSLGLIYMGEFGEKHINYKTALRYNKRAYEFSKSIATKSVLANNYYWLDELEKAKELYLELVDFNIHDLTSKYYLGLTYFELGENEDAKALLSEVIMMDKTYIPGNEEVLNELGLAYDKTK